MRKRRNDVGKQRVFLPKKTSPVKELRLREVAQMIQRGTSQIEMARKYNVSEMQISHDVKEVIQRWADRTMEEAELLTIAVERHMGLAQKALDEFDRRQIQTTWHYVICSSCIGKGYKRNKGACPDCDGEGEIRAAREKKMSTAGDVQLLSVAQKAFVEASRLQGLYLERRDTREDQASQVLEQHQHIHLESNQFQAIPSEDLIKVQSMLERLLEREKYIDVVEGSVQSPIMKT